MLFSPRALTQLAKCDRLYGTPMKFWQRLPGSTQCCGRVLEAV